MTNYADVGYDTGVRKFTVKTTGVATGGLAEWRCWFELGDDAPLAA